MLNIIIDTVLAAIIITLPLHINVSLLVCRELDKEIPLWEVGCNLDTINSFILSIL